MFDGALIVGILMSIFIFIIPVFSYEIRQSRSVLFAYWFVVLLHQLVAFTNAFWFTTLGAGRDAVAFQQIGEERALSGDFSFGIGGNFYTSLLGASYKIFGVSHLLGEQLSVLAFSFSCVLLLKISRLLEMTRYQATCILIFGALPTMVLLGSVTLRESFQVMFFMLAVYYGIKMHLKRGVNVYLFFLVLASFLMGVFHNGLLVYSFFMIMLFMIWTLYPASRIENIKSLRGLAFLVIPLILISVAIFSQAKIEGLGALSSIADMHPLEAAAKYRGYSPESRAKYGVVLDLSSPLMAIYSSSLVYVNYVLAPFPWQVRNILDVYAFLESVLRLIFLLFAIQAWKRSGGAQRRLRGMVLMLFFSMTLLWAMGTSNYGTATRHHMLDWWILVIMGLPLLVDTVRNVFINTCYSVRSKPSEKSGREA